MTVYKIVVLLIVLSGYALAGEKSEAWRALSARSQNIHNELLILTRDNTAADPSNHEQDLKAVEDALDTLVKLGELHSRKVTLKSPKDLGQELTAKFFSEVESLSKNYGIFVAREMCGVGAHLYFTTIKEDEEMELHLRLPISELESFEESLRKLGVLAKTNAQQE